MVELLALNHNNEYVSLDLSSDSSIAFNVTLTDYSNPSVIKNWFSKTITLLGSIKNNEFFNKVYNVNTLTSLFSPNKKTTCFINIDGKLFDNGYFVLDSIKKSKSKIEYSITYYSVMGQFLYNLSTNIDTEESVNLSDLYFGLPNASRTGFLTKSEENAQTEVFQLNSETLYDMTENYTYLQNWKSYKRTLREIDLEKWLYANICWIPCYNGLSEDDDNDKTLIYKPSQKTLDAFGVPTTYVGFNHDYYVGTYPRDVDQWEVKDFRPSNQLFGIRYSFILDACFNPENNGGFVVNFPYEDDFESIVGAVYNNSFIVQKKLEFEDNEDYEVDEVIIPNHTIKFSWDSTHDTLSFPSKLKEEQHKWISQNCQLSGLLSLGIKRTDYYSENIAQLYTICSTTETNASTSNYMEFNSFGIKLTYFDIDNVYKTEYYVIGASSSKFKEIYGSVEKFLSDNKSVFDELQTQYKGNRYYTYYTKGKFIDVDLVYKSGDYSGINWVNDNVISIIIQNITKNWNYNYFTIDFEPLPGHFLSKDKFSYPTTDSSQFSQQPFFIGTTQDSSGNYHNVSVLLDGDNTKLTFLDDSGANYISRFYSGETSEIGINVVKKVNLFNSEKTPCDYLLNFIKMLNLRLVYNSIDNRIDILTLDDFYAKYKLNDNYIIDLNDSNSPVRIDYNNDISINYNFYENRKIDYCFTQADTYPEYLYRKSENNTYMNKYTFDTKNETLDNSSEDYLDSELLTSCVDYNERSNYYTYLDADGNNLITPMLKGASFTFSYFKTDSEYETEDLDKTWNKQTKALDPIPKLALFDKENSTVEGEFICFYEGIVNLNDKYTLQISNKTRAMKSINDDKSCFIYWNDEFNRDEGEIIGVTQFAPTQTGTLGYNIKKLLKFGMNNYYYNNKYETFNLNDDYTLERLGTHLPQNGLYWNLPKKLYSNSELPKCSLYSSCFEKYNDDMYNKNVHTLTCSCLINETYNIDWLTRHKYLLDGSLYVINKITDYNPDGRHIYSVEFRRTFIN